MTPDEPRPGEPHPSQRRQAWAWLKAAHPADALRQEMQGEVFWNQQNTRAEQQLDRSVVERWLDERDVALPAHIQRLSDVAQAMAWLGPGTEFAARQAHSLAVTNAEISLDQDRLLAHWRQGRDLDLVPDRTERYVAELLAIREERLEHAKTRARTEAPDEFGQWQTRRGYADTLGDAYGDDRDLIRRWLTTEHPSGAPAAASEHDPTHPGDGVPTRHLPSRTSVTRTATTSTSTDPSTGTDLGL